MSTLSKEEVKRLLDLQVEAYLELTEEPGLSDKVCDEPSLIEAFKDYLEMWLENHEESQRNDVSDE